MKTKVITGLKKEVLVIEAKSKDIACGFIFNKYGLKELLKWELLGKPDEISEEDVRSLVSDFDAFENSKYYYLHGFWKLIEKEIYWENPIEVHTWASENADIYYKKWKEAQEKTFERNRTLIFVKN